MHGEKRSVTLSFGEMLNSGSARYYARVNEVIMINDTKESKKWQISLGKRDFNQAIIEKYENNTQKALLFTKIGTYQVKLSSHPSNAQGTIMMQAVTIIVK